MIADDEEDHDHSLESPQDISLGSTAHSVDFKYQRYPYCIVWTPIPFLSWILPMIGHVGIATYIIKARVRINNE